MAVMAEIRRVVARPRARLLDAERRFFDAYSRGGSHDPRSLVIPLDYFVRQDVRKALEAWVAGERGLDERALERAWRAAADPVADAGRFYRNLAHFVSLV